MVIRQGRVKFWNSDKGYGFIAGDHGTDTFAHVSGLTDNAPSLATGDRVEYEIDYDQRSGREKAVNVRLLA